MLFDAFSHAKSEAEQPWIFCQSKFKMRDRRLSDDYASLIFKYCDEHPDFPIKYLAILVKKTKSRFIFKKKTS